MARKGHTNNPHGRPKGTPNRTTEQIREAVRLFIDDNLQSLQDDFDQLEPKDRLAFFERLLKHVMPTPLNDLERLSDDQLDQLIQRLKSEHMRVI